MSKGLYYNIAQKKKRIANGSGEKMRKAGDTDAPTAKDFKKSAKTAKKPKRDYAKEYGDYHKKPSQVKRRAARNKARRMLEKRGLVKKGDKREVDHKDFNPRNNKRSNLRVVSRTTNRRRQPK